MFEHLSLSATRVIVMAQQEAKRQRCKCVATEHVLLGLLRTDNSEFRGARIDEKVSVIAAVLESFGVDIRKARKELDAVIIKEHCEDDNPFTETCKLMIERSWTVARELGDEEIDPKHLLLALLEDRKCGACKLLAAMNVDSIALCVEVRSVKTGE
jgi:ATP-dependent Clp protease ATP-binding subunit ClpA